jgi:hypothetical protein
MNGLTSTFLKARHWQLFVLTFGIPIVFQFVMIGSMMAKVGEGSAPDMPFTVYYRLFPVMMILFMSVFFGWFWSVAIGLQTKIPPHVHMSVKRFKILFFIPVAYMFLLFIFLGGAMSGMIKNAEEPSPEFMASVAGIVIPLHLFSMFCIFHSLYFAAKTFKTAELQREVSFSDFAGEFFMLWFYPIGIWIVQPKINKMVEE